MPTIIIVAIVVVVVILIAFIISYNGFVHLNNKIDEAFSTMDVYLKKRWDLVPNLVEVVKGYAKHEESLLKEIVELRNGSKYDDMSDEEKLKANSQITRKLHGLIALAENYPELKANENFIDLNQKLEKIEEDIASSRKYYNATVRSLNDKVRMFPSNLVAKIFGFKTREMFNVGTPKERENVKVEF